MPEEQLHLVNPFLLMKAQRVDFLLLAGDPAQATNVRAENGWDP